MCESLCNPDFKPLEFERFKRETGLNAFPLSPKKWIEMTNAIGLISNSGRYGKPCVTMLAMEGNQIEL